MTVASVHVCFHGIGVPRRELEPGEEPFWISRDSFLRLLDELRTWPRAVLSFDDANESDLTIALPALLERGLRAEFFVLAARLGQPGSLSADSVRELRSQGMVIGSHGMAHQPWRKLSAADLQAEFVEAREIIADAADDKAAVRSVACPLGQYDRRTLTRLRQLGYERVYSSDRYLARPGAWLQPRFSVHQGETPASLREAVSASASPLGGSVARAKSVVKRLR